MTAMTSEELGITSPAEKAAAARRRDATKRVRWVRDRLTSTSGTPAFDYELLRQFAQNRQSASLPILLLVAAGGLAEQLHRFEEVAVGAFQVAVQAVEGLQFVGSSAATLASLTSIGWRLFRCLVSSRSVAVRSVCSRQ